MREPRPTAKVVAAVPSGDKLRERGVRRTRLKPRVHHCLFAQPPTAPRPPALTSPRRCPTLPRIMQHLHAYWRMEYIEAPRLPDTGDIFTALPALGDDAQALIVHRSPLSYLVLNRFPYNAGHLLAVPFRAASDLTELTAAERADLMDEIVFGKELLKAALSPQAFNIGLNLGSASGGSIPHLHAHIVPRWQGDTNFMPVIGETRVLPQSLEAMYRRLTETLPQLPARV